MGIADIVRATGLSRATVDRALNGRGHVHARTREVVNDALATLRTSSGSRPSAEADMVLRVGRGMMGQMRAAWDRTNPAGRFVDMYQARESEMVEMLKELCRDVGRPLIVTVKNTDRIAASLAEARGRGKRIVALVSDLAPDARDVFVGIDNRAAGQTAAWLIGRSFAGRPASVGVVVGDAAFRCHEDREIGFRTGLRQHFPKVAIAGEASGEDSAELTEEAVLRMIREKPSIRAIYNVGGGNSGVAEALRKTGRVADVAVVAHDANAVTSPLLREAAIESLIASDPAALFSAALRETANDARGDRRDAVLLDFAVYTRFNLPSFAAIA